MLEWLAGKNDDLNEHGLFWTCRKEADTVLRIYAIPAELAEYFAV